MNVFVHNQSDRKTNKIEMYFIDLLCIPSEI